MPTNEQARALSDAWFAADRAQAKSMLRHEMGDVTDQLSQLTNEIRDQQQDVRDERGQWNTTGSVLGCLGGGIIGFIFGYFIACLMMMARGNIEPDIDWECHSFDEKR